MTTAEKISFKQSLKLFCQQTIAQRMDATKALIQDAQDAANNEEKSSAGDKYETSRAMGHLQKDMHTRQLEQYIKEQSELMAVQANVLCEQAVAGAFIQTGQAAFFIAAGLGKQRIESQSIFFLSPHAPLAQALQGKKKGDSFVFNNNTITIAELF
ncbi:MAG: hypothetical protein QM726_05515 [Chitinophagaceae bacterium]